TAHDGVQPSSCISSKAFALPKRKLEDRIGRHAMPRSIQRICALAKPVIGVFRGLEEEAIQIFDVLRPCPRTLIRNAFDKTPLRLDGHRMVLMAGSIR